MRIAQINVVSSLSTGRIAVSLCKMAEENGHKALLCHSRDHAPKSVSSYRIGSFVDTYLHIFLSRITDRSGFFSKRATEKLVAQLKSYKPDLIHLHNLHGYYLHLPTLFAYLKESRLPVVWTLHDCWAYTGHCAYYTMAPNTALLNETVRSRVKKNHRGCERWISGCHHCPLKRSYPASLLMDQSARNWKEKQALFSQLPYLVLTTPSEWLRQEVMRSYLGHYPVYTLPNGIDLNTFKPCEDASYLEMVMRFYHLDRAYDKQSDAKLVLSVAAVWDERKGLEDLIELSQALGTEKYIVAAVGLSNEQIAALPSKTVVGLPRTGNVKDLCALYTAADVYVSTSREETMGMTLVEALACGTQVICYDATAMPEIVTSAVGETVPTGKIGELADAVRRLCDEPKAPRDCLARAGEYDSQKRYADYLRLYEKMYSHSEAYLEACKKSEGNT